MGYRVKRIKALEEENKRLTEENEYWKREALKWAAKLGENKMKIRGLLDKLGIPESDIKENELEKFIEA